MASSPSATAPADGPGLRQVSASIDLECEGDAEFLLAVAVATEHETSNELLRVRQHGRDLPVEQHTDRLGSRLHAVRAGTGPVEIRYSADVGPAVPAPIDPLDAWTYLRPSRYCEADTLRPVARAEFAGLERRDLLAAVSSWVGTRLAYVPGSSTPIDGAVATLLARRGVCRDFAHLTTALLRAVDVPARIVSVYAPGLDPMDFHAVTEALVDGAWQVVDATALAPRSSLVRIATGRDAADTAFLTTRSGLVRLVDLEVAATAEHLPGDDLDRLVTIG